MRRPLHPLLTVLVALLLLAFTGGPVVLTLVGSLIPDRVLLSPDRSILEEGLTLDNYRYIFTGELPASYQRADANRAMISDARPDRSPEPSGTRRRSRSPRRSSTSLSAHRRPSSSRASGFR
jgi:hypothetical protein